MPDAISSYFDEAMAARAQAIETACEAALQSGAYGVRVRSGWERTDNDLKFVTEAWVDHTVPYGHIVEEPLFGFF